MRATWNGERRNFWVRHGVRGLTVLLAALLVLGAAAGARPAAAVDESGSADGGPSTGYEINADAPFTREEDRNNGLPVLNSDISLLAAYSDWDAVGGAVNSGTLTGTNFKPSGSGTAASPYQIYTPEALAWYAYMIDWKPSVYGATYAVCKADLDLTGTNYGGTSAAPLVWRPIWDYNGNFNGSGYTISRMQAVPESLNHAGLFGYTQNATIRGVTLVNSSVSGYSDLGGVAGIMKGGTVVDCSFSGAVISKGGSGGTGGIVGAMNSGTIQRCSMMGSPGYVDGGNSSGNAGGIVGVVRGTAAAAVTIQDCYNLGVVYGKKTSSSGGILGSDENGTATIKNCYSTAMVQAAGTAYPLAPTGVSAANCYYVGSTSGVGKSKTAAQLKTWAAAYALNGGSKTGVWNYNSSGYPTLRSSSAAMTAAADWSVVGRGIYDGFIGAAPTGNPVTLDSPEDLAWFSYVVNNYNSTYGSYSARLAGDYSMMGSSYGMALKWVPIGTAASPYKGTFTSSSAGTQRSISYLTINRPTDDYNGIFGYTSGAVISDLALSGGTVTGRNYNGGIVGWMKGGTLTNCSNNVWVSNSTGGGDYGIGGIVGAMDGGTVSKCWTTISCVVDSQKNNWGYAGGIVGQTLGSASIQNCYSRARVGSGNDVDTTKTTSAGGIMGYTSSGSATVRYCYATGKLTAYSTAKAYGVAPSSASITNCYYDSETAGTVTDVTGAVARTTAEMKGWGTACLLNNSSWGASGKTWALDTANTNNGYPIFGTSLRAPTDWQEVGSAQGTAPVLSSGAYQLDTPEKLAWFMYQVNVGGKTDYSANLSGANLTGATWGGSTAAPLKWIPIGTAAKPYEGTFAGSGNTPKSIDYMRIDRTESNNGLFGCTQNATISNLIMQSTCTVTGGGHSGGLIGYMTGGSLTYCINNGKVRNTTAGGDFGIGGLVGCLNGGTVQRCWTDTTCVVDSQKNGHGFTGGIVGQMSASSTILNCFNNARVGSESDADGSEASRTGGILANVSGGAATIRYCYTIGKVAAWTTCYALAPAGGSITNCYYQNDVGGVATSAGESKTAVQLKTWAAMYALNGGSTTGWWNYSGNQYPSLGHISATRSAAADWSVVGQGVHDGFIGKAPDMRDDFDSVEDLAWFAYKLNSTEYPQEYIPMATGFTVIDLTGAAYGGTAAAPLKWVPIGTAAKPFKWNFSGANNGVRRTVKNMLVDRAASNNGFFGYTQGADISGLDLDRSCTVIGDEYNGGIIGYMSGGRLSDCSSDGTVRIRATGKDNGAGGIVGAVKAGTVERCWTGPNGLVDTLKNNTGVAGGIVGQTFDTVTIEDCYNQARVGGESTTDATRAHYAGGITVGPAFGTLTIKYCYTIGKVTATGAAYGFSESGNITNCYYQNGVGSTSGRGVSKTAEQLKTWAAAYALNGGKRGSVWTYNSNNYPTLGSATLPAADDWSVVGRGVYDGFIGTIPGASSPVTLDSPEDLAWFSYAVNNANATYGSYSAKLAGNCALTGTAYGGAASAAGALRWVPIGTSTSPYKGKFSSSAAGTQRTISYMRIDREADYNGLFGYTKGATIERVTLDGTCTVAGKQMNGGIIGYMEGGEVTQCANYGTVQKATGQDYSGIGGIVGYLNAGKVEQCWTGQSCVVDTRVGGYGNAGGIVGYAQGAAVVRNSYNRARVGSTNDSDTTKSSHSSGIIGDETTAAKIEHCYSTGKVTGITMFALSPGKGTVTNSYYQDDVGSTKGKGAARTAAEMKGWGTAYLLNTKYGASGMVWTLDNPTTPANDGYPVFGASLRAPESWLEVGTAQTTAPKGAGSAGDPYQLDTAEKLAWFISRYYYDSGERARCAKLTADIDLAGSNAQGGVNWGGTDANPLRWISGSGWSIQYSGTFDGGGHVIRNMRVAENTVAGNWANAYGFFGGLKGATVKNVIFDKCTVTVTKSGAGTGAEGGVVAGITTGGIIQLEQCGVSATCKVNGVTADAAYSMRVGGLIGDHEDGTLIINNCYSRATVGGNINATGKSGQGGLIGITYKGSTSISNSYASTGWATGAKGEFTLIGAFAGTSSTATTITKCCYDAGEKSVDKVNGVYGRSTAEMKAWGAPHFLNGGRYGDSGMVWTLDSTTTPINGGYPVFGASLRKPVDWLEVGSGQFDTPKGEGTADNPYQLGTDLQLAWFINQYYYNADKRGLCAKLTADIDLIGTNDGGTAAKPLRWISGSGRTMQYSGTFDGGGHTIRNMRVAENTVTGPWSNAYGFFGGLNGATVKNVRFDSCTVTVTKDGGGNGAEMGILAGISVGKDVRIEECGVNGTCEVNLVNADSNYAGRMGGLMGGHENGNLKIKNCYSRAVIGATTSAGNSGRGSLLGYKYQGTMNISYSYATTGWESDATGQETLVGFLATGQAAPTITNCYYDAGDVSAAALNGVTGRTTAEMKAWGTAYLLNTGYGASGMVWNLDTANANGGYPVFGTSLRPPDNWLEVGSAQLTVPKLDKGAYRLSKAEELAWFLSQVNLGGRTDYCVGLEKNIDLTGADWGGTAAEPLPWIPIGNETKSFEGKLGCTAGIPRTISNMRIVGAEKHNGLVGVAKGGNEFSNITLENCSITTTGNYTAGFVGMTQGAVELINCNVSGSITGNDYVGGLVGEAGSTGDVKLTGCTNRAALSSKGEAGGIVGTCYNATLTIENCYNRGAISSPSAAAGRGIGGILGRRGNIPAVIKNCYNTGALTGGTAKWAISGGSQPLTNCYYDSQTTGTVTAVTGANPRTTAEMKAWGAAYLLNGSKYGASGMTWTLDNPTTPANDGYPVYGASLRKPDNWLEVGSAQLAAPAYTDKYRIRTPENLAWILWQVNGNGRSDCALAFENNVDLTGSANGWGGTAATPLEWVPIGTEKTPFTGAFGGATGAQKTISHLRVDRVGSYNGLLGYAGNAVISMLTLDGTCSVTGTDYNGGIVGYLKGGTLIGCANYGSVSNTSAGKNTGLGGIAGAVVGVGNDTLVEKCWTGASCVVDGQANKLGYAGGIVGQAENTVTLQYCYNRGRVGSTGDGDATMPRSTGGINGAASSARTIKSCYSTGPVKGEYAYDISPVEGTVTDCYYQNDTGSSTKSAGTARNAKEMKSWGTVFLLNGEKYGNKDIVWTLDNPTTPANGGYPVFGASLRAPDNWLEVGSAQIEAPPFSQGGYRISTPEQLAWVLWQVNKNNQTSYSVGHNNSIDLAGAGTEGNKNWGGTAAKPLKWVPLGSDAAPFTGGFGCTGGIPQTIKNLRVEQTGNNAGIIGVAGTGVSVSNLSLVNCSVTTAGYYAGAFIGKTTGAVTVEGCHVLGGSISGKDNVGGLIGEASLYGAVTVSRCSNRAAVSSGLEAGGIVGCSHAATLTIENCYNRGAVSATGANAVLGIGGILGRRGTAVLRSCYNTGALTGGTSNTKWAISGGDLTNTHCYYDSQTTGTVTAVTGAVGRTTAEMKAIATLRLLNAGPEEDAFFPDVKKTNDGYPVLILEGDTLLATGTVGAGRLLDPADIRLDSAKITGDSILSGRFVLTFYQLGVKPGQVCAPAVAGLSVQLGGTIPKGTVLTASWVKSGGGRAYGQYTANANVASAPLTSFTKLGGGTLSPADLMAVQEQELMLYADFTACGGAGSGEVKLIVDPAAGKTVYTVQENGSMSASKATAPAVRWAVEPTVAEGVVSFTVSASNGAWAEGYTAHKAADAGVVFRLKQNGTPLSFPIDAELSTDGGTTWRAPSCPGYSILSLTGGSAQVKLRGLPDGDYTVELICYQGEEGSDAAAPRGGWSAMSISKDVKLDNSRQPAVAVTGEQRIFDLTGGALQIPIIVRTVNAEGCVISVTAQVKGADGVYADTAALLAAGAKAAVEPDADGSAVLSLSAGAEKGTYRLMFQLEKDGKTVAAFPYNIILKEP